MDKEKGVSKLLIWLDDEDVKQKLREIMKPFFVSSNDSISSPEYKEQRIGEDALALKEECDKLNNDLSKMKDKVSSLETQLSDEKEKIESIRKEKDDLEETIKKLEAEKKTLDEQYNALGEKYADYDSIKDTADYYNGMFAEAERQYRNYMKISSALIEKLKHIICAENLIKFMTSCLDMKNLERLWDFIHANMNQGFEQNDITVIIGVFEYFFGLCNSYLSTPTYTLDDVRIGDVFDDEYHIRTKDGQVQGKIVEILLRGYRSVTSGKSIRKSVVIARREA
ncbi:MAG: hypothetical protein NC299_04045 [Lachnospiraceae bacterium]|nr:hypothetical protein [Ruminococcus sp.]MCM1274519.1 hypothetical protein [Lachnospiraceae bacterium]